MLDECHAGSRSVAPWPLFTGSDRAAARDLMARVWVLLAARAFSGEACPREKRVWTQVRRRKCDPTKEPRAFPESTLIGKRSGLDHRKYGRSACQEPAVG